MTPPSVTFGFANFGKGAKIETVDEAQKFLDVLKTHKVNFIDTSRRYADGGSEEILGELGASQEFKVSTKIFPALSTKTPELLAGKNNRYSHSAKDVHDALQASLKSLGTNRVDIYYLHAPDRVVPFEETLAAINEEYKAGRFERFGISNFNAQDIEKIIDLCEKNNWLKPSVFQGMYNAMNRSTEKEILPVLRKNNISFVAYSALAAGFFTMKEDEAVGTGKRYNEESKGAALYRSLYWNEKSFKVLGVLRELAESHKIGMIELAIRWIYYHSALDGDHGDMVLLASSSPTQLEANLLDIKKGPLPSELVDAMEQGWHTLKDTAVSMESKFV